MSFNSVCNYTRDKQIGLSLRGRPILLTDRIGLHSVLLPLLIPGLSRPALKTVLLLIYSFYCIRGQFWLIAFRRKGKGKEKLVSLIFSNPFPFITSITAVPSYTDALWARHAIMTSPKSVWVGGYHSISLFPFLY